MTFAKAPTRSRIVVGCTDNTVRVIGPGGNNIATATGHTDWVYAVAASPDGSRLASGSGGGTVKIWGPAGKLLRTLGNAAPPPALEPLQPVLVWIYPAGGQRCTTIEVTASGTSIVPQTVLVSGGGVTANANNGKLSLTIDADAEPGERDLRILNAGGVSNRFRFMVGELPEITEMEPNSEKSAPQKIASLPVVIDGQILDTDRDYFQFPAKAGATLVLSVEARSLLPFIADAVPGWFDPQLTVYDAAGKQIAFADDNRFRPDPLLFFRAPSDGEYTVELRDVVYRGRGDFIYRLTAVMRKAEPSESLMQAFAYTHVLPTRQLFLAVIPGTAYTIASSIADGKMLEVKPGSDTPITAVRLANNTITTKGVFVAPEKDEAEVVLSVSKDAKVGLRQDVILSGLMRANNQSIVRYARAIPVIVK